MSLAATSPAVGSFYLSRSHRAMPRFTMAVRSGALTVTPILTKLQKDCATPLPLLRRVADAMESDMRAGLSADGGSDLKMILSYVDSLPSGYAWLFIFNVLFTLFNCLLLQFNFPNVDSSLMGVCVSICSVFCYFFVFCLNSFSIKVTYLEIITLFWVVKEIIYYFFSKSTRS